MTVTVSVKGPEGQGDQTTFDITVTRPSSSRQTEEQKAVARGSLSRTNKHIETSAVTIVGKWAWGSGQIVEFRENGTAVSSMRMQVHGGAWIRRRAGIRFHGHRFGSIIWF